VQHLRWRPVCRRNALEEGSARCLNSTWRLFAQTVDPDFALEPPNIMTEMWVRYPEGRAAARVKWTPRRPDKELQMSIFHASIICKTSNLQHRITSWDHLLYQGYSPNIDANLLID